MKLPRCNVFVIPQVALALVAATIASGCNAESPSDPAGPGASNGASGGTGAAGAGGRAGTGAAADAGGAATGPGPAPALGAVVLSEVMYHPVGEVTADDLHEFVELANRGDAPVALAGWTLTLGNKPAFTFPAGATLPARGFVVVARDPARLAALPAYRLTPAQLLGPYAGELDNDDGRVALVDAAGARVDELRYLGRAPWPLGADALGAGEDWLPAEQRPIAKHAFMGRSLERVSLDGPTGDPANWEASALDGATPGRVNGASGTPRAVILRLDVGAAEAAGAGTHVTPARPMQPIVVRAWPSAFGAALADALVEYFVDDVNREDEPAARAPALAKGDHLEATLPGQPGNAIVRYRVRARRGATDEIVSPRPGDPFAWHATFVAPAAPDAQPGKSSVVHAFIARERWAELYKNIAAGRVATDPATKKFVCDANPTWNARMPAVVVVGGQVIDAMARYQGSPFNRANGTEVKTWPAADAPGAPTNVKLLSWHFTFPRYASPGGRRHLLLHKRAPDCNFMTMGAAGRLFESVGIPSARVSLARLFVNGHYYHFMTEFERYDELMLKRAFGKEHVVGDLFKSVGYLGDQGPYFNGDLRAIPARPECKQSVEDRFAATYDRKTPSWKSGSAEVLELSRKFEEARAGGVEAVRRFFADNFDVPKVVDYVAILNWLAPWDDYFQNFFLYRRGADGKWMFLPWDFDSYFATGFGSDVNASFFVGEIGNRSNRSAGGERWVSLWKDAFIKAFRAELTARWKTLVAKELSPEAVGKAADEAAAIYGEDEARRSPWFDGGGAFCRAEDYMTATGQPRLGFKSRIKDFVPKRNALVEAEKW